ncbi:hypothetical protein DM860_016623 [Cuscuta australis]|uniref:Uncharacterized protein n=1 Tax=Cuscuta australis TaxID=267555 RepID=A0A328DLQ9_9ASTE|nr:hypothetical protein DM860_016623 [Cuscuta australis]
MECRDSIKLKILAVMGQGDEAELGYNVEPGLEVGPCSPKRRRAQVKWPELTSFNHCVAFPPNLLVGLGHL